MALAEEEVTLCLLDVLRQSPRDVVAHTFCAGFGKPEAAPEQMSDSAWPSHLFRLVSRQSRLLADQLTRRLRLRLPLGEGRQVALSSQSAALGRLERLEHLMLDGDADGRHAAPADSVDIFVIKTLLMGRRALQHLQSLSIHASPSATLSNAAGSAIQLCCPSLRELVLFGYAPEAAFLAPLRDCTALQKVTIYSRSLHLNEDVCCSLAALPSLQSLDLYAKITYEAAALLLAGCAGLRELKAEFSSITSCTSGQALDLGNALGRLTQLTSLNVPRVEQDGALDALIGQLGGLPHLANLSFGKHGGELTGQRAYDAVVQLTALTRLSCPAVSPRVSGPAGRLSHLRELLISGFLCPADLAGSLQFLLPLPSLRAFHCNVRCSHHEADGGANAAPGSSADPTGARATAASQAAGALAQMPGLEEVHLRVKGFEGPQSFPPQDSGLYASEVAGVVCALLLPLGAVLTELVLSNLEPGVLEAAWPVLCMATGLKSLTFVLSHVPESRLLSAVGPWGSLQKLRMLYCTGVRRDSAVALAGVRMKPLSVWWEPELSEEQRTLFRAAAQAGVTLDK